MFTTEPTFVETIENTKYKSHANLFLVIATLHIERDENMS